MPIKYPWWKLIAGFLFFVVFHQIYQWTGGNMIGMIFGEKISSVFPHMKMLFYAYLLVCIIDYCLHRKVIILQPFLFSRMLILSTIPWLMIAIFYTPVALGLVLQKIAELTWGIIMTGVGLYFCVCMEEPFTALPLRNSAKVMLVLAFLATTITYIGFSFTVPDNFFFVTGR